MTKLEKTLVQGQIKHTYNESMKRITLEKDDRKIRWNIVTTVKADEGENRTGITSQAGIMGRIKLKATNLWYGEGKYERLEDGDTGGNNNGALHKNRMQW